MITKMTDITGFIDDIDDIDGTRRPVADDCVATRFTLVDA